MLELSGHIGIQLAEGSSMSWAPAEGSPNPGPEKSLYGAREKVKLLE